MKLGHAADRECRAVGRARSSSAAPQPEGLQLACDQTRAPANALSFVRPPLRAPAKIVRARKAWKVSGKRRQIYQGNERGVSRRDRWTNLSAGRVRSSAKSGPILIARYEGRRDLATPARIGQKLRRHFSQKVNRLERYIPRITLAKLTKFSSASCPSTFSRDLKYTTFGAVTFARGCRCDAIGT